MGYPAEMKKRIVFNRHNWEIHSREVAMETKWVREVALQTSWLYILAINKNQRSLEHRVMAEQDKGKETSASEYMWKAAADTLESTLVLTPALTSLARTPNSSLCLQTLKYNYSW